jgi:hypothetical protein
MPIDAYEASLGAEGTFEKNFSFFVTIIEGDFKEKPRFS